MAEGVTRAVDRLYDLLSARGATKGSADKFVALCPAHEDRKPSLSVQVGRDSDRAVLKCFADCSTEAILAELGLESRDLFDAPHSDGHGVDAPREEWTPCGPATAIYDYRDESGHLLYQVLRTADKQFPQRRPDATAKSGWRWNLGDTRRVLFRLPELIQGINEGRTVCIAEGEKDVLRLVAAGRVATCNPGGAGNGKWRPEFAGIFAGVDVTIFADKDKVGQAHARAIAASLGGIASRVWIVEAAEPYKDISDQLAAGLPVEAAVTTFDPSHPPKLDLAPDLLDLLASDSPDYDWLVPGLLERGDRLMITGREGLGKSQLIRQLVVCFGAGLHPFTFRDVKPLRVLVVDCENSDRQNRRKYGPIVGQAQVSGFPLQREQVRIIARPEGKNLPDPDDAAWLLERVTAHDPDVLVVGPLYQLHLENPNNEETARKVAAALNVARTQIGCAVIIETHSGHGETGKARPIRPVGSSLWLRWPEFGYGLRPVEEQQAWEIDDVTRCDFNAWRGPRDERAWPRSLYRPPPGGRSGVFWPWTEYVDP